MRKKDVEEQKVKTKLQGFNSIFAVAGIPFVKLYYTEFKRQMEALPSNRQLKIATISAMRPMRRKKTLGLTKILKAPKTSTNRAAIS